MQRFRFLTASFTAPFSHGGNGGTPRAWMETTRLEAFSDGLFAIVMTLLVFNLKIPDQANPDQLAHLLLGLKHQFIICAVSFILVGFYWIAHHAMFSLIARVDRNLLWLNLLFLLTVVLLPYPTNLLIVFHKTRLAYFIYGCNLMAVNLAAMAMWEYACHKDVLQADILPGFRRFVSHLFSLQTGLYLLTMLLSLWNKHLALFLLILIPAFFILPNPWLEYWLHHVRSPLSTISLPLRRRATDQKKRAKKDRHPGRRPTKPVLPE